MNILISQFVGFLAFGIFVFSMQQKDKTRILFVQIISFFLYALQYLLIKAYPGMIVFIINMIRSIVFFCTMKKKQPNKIIFIIFILLSILCGKLVYKDIYDILPICASLLSVVFTWQPKTKILRYGQIGICILWIIYDAFVMAYIGIVTESIIIISTIVALLNNDYNINIAEFGFKCYLKVRYNANEGEINLSPSLPHIKLRLLRFKKRRIFGN